MTKRLISVNGWEFDDLIHLLGSRQFCAAMQHTPVFQEVCWSPRPVIHRCRRPRLFWLKGLDVVESQELKLVGSQRVGEISFPMFQAKITTAKPPMEWFLQANCTKLTQPEEPFFTFARPHPKQQEPSEAAGKERCSDKALQEQALPIPLAAMQLQDSS